MLAPYPKSGADRIVGRILTTKNFLPVVLCWLLGAASPAVATEQLPNILLITVDTLRADRMSAYGYERPTSPHLDALMAEGARFADARTVEPLTAPGLTSMLTALHPHEHGATRNGVAMRSDLPSLPRMLKRQGYRTAAFVANWTLRDRISGLGEHFDDYNTVLERKRWLLFASESTADDVNRAAETWFAAYRKNPERPFFVWLHYVEPHGPYRYWEQYAGRLQADRSKSSRYDTEIAYVDERISQIVGRTRDLGLDRDLAIVFMADHGESLGEHGYWGHGRHVYDATLRIPMAVVWPGQVQPMVVEQPALNIDLPKTLLSLLGLQGGEYFGGHDWSPSLEDGNDPVLKRVTYFQSHRGAVKNDENREKVRTNGLLEVARIEDGRKEILRIPSQVRREFALADDVAEEVNLVPPKSRISADLQRWLEEVRAGLALADELPPPSLGEEDMEELRALGYLD